MSDAGRPRSGTVTLVGWTNVGKSTLLNRLVGTKLAAVADVAQTTRHRIRGALWNPDRGQIVFVDTPGIHRPRYRMNHAMVERVSPPTVSPRHPNRSDNRPLNGPTNTRQSAGAISSKPTSLGPNSSTRCR